ncbi:MAG: acyl-CoA dehydrogenase [Myxococcales bacterium]|nr:acyl-CoA dehydrogenase [Myxococcales bacterium]
MFKSSSSSSSGSIVIDLWSDAGTVGLQARFAYTFSEDHHLLRDSMLSFARDQIAPGAAKRDQEREFPLALVAELGEMGIMAARVPESHGGPAVDTVGYTLILEALGRADVGLASVVAATNLVAVILSEQATAAQRERWLLPLCTGAAGAASFCLTEPGGGSDAAALTTTVIRDGDDFVLNGSKMWITSGGHAGVYLVFARTESADGTKGISTFVVDPGTRGLEIGKDEPKMGQRCSGTTALHFDDCKIPAANLIGPLHGGYRAAISSLGAGRIGISGACIGVAEAALSLGLGYAEDRKAFGKPIAHFQTSQFMLADCRTELDAAWLLTLRAAFLHDAGHRADAASSMAKLVSSETTDRIVDRMLQLHGGYGYSEEYPIERLYRDSRVLRIYEGTSEIQRMIIARSLF